LLVSIEMTTERLGRGGAEKTARATPPRR